MNGDNRESSPASERTAEPQPQTAPRPGCLVVGMGASAGGLEAFEQFFAQVPPESGMAFVLVQHLAPDHASLLPELVAKYTRMSVRQVEEETPVEPNHVYVIPPDATLTIDRGVLHLMSPPVEPRFHRMPIDNFFRSLAEDQGENAVCILLSGAGADGTLGLRAVKEHGGIAIAQTPASARYDSLVRSAISTGLVDYVLPVKEMPAKLTEYAAHLTALRVTNGLTGFHPEVGNHLHTIHGLLKRQTGHDFSQYKENTVIRRIQRRLQVLQLDAVDAYLALLKQDPRELDLLFKDLLIGVTQFFRDPEAFAALEREVIPALFADKGADDQVRVGVSGCASGEEAYSIAILLREHLATLAVAPRVQVFATDIDEHALENARKGCYSLGIAEQVTPERLERFFVKQDNLYQVKKELREVCLFSVHSLVKDPPFSRLDLISCRNVLIYLGPELQQKLTRLFHYALRPSGYLFLGPSETLTGQRALFRTLDKKHRLFQKKDTISRQLVEFPFSDVHRPPQRQKDESEHTHTVAARNIGTLVERTILDSYAPACVVTNEHGEAVYFSGRTGRYLEPPTGTPNVNVLNMSRAGLRLPLRTALQQAVITHQRVVREKIPVQTNGDVQPITLVVQPMTERVDDSSLYLIIFQDGGPTENTTHVAADAPPSGPEDVHLRSLEHELQATREHLQTTIEELETTNEELGSANEEFQSTNEELETSKEELQSLNEELETVNAELRRKVDDLDRTNSDLQNLFDSTQVATIFLDRELRIRNFTPAASTLFPLLPGDVGRPFTDLAPRFVGSDLVSDAKDTLSTLSRHERTLHTVDADAHYLMRIIPYRTIDHVIDGVVLTFVDVTDLKHAEEAAHIAQVYAESLVATVREPLLVLNADLHVRLANRAFYETFHSIPAETEGRLLYNLGDSQWNIPELRRVLTEVLPQNRSFENFEVTHDFPTIGQRIMRLNARQVQNQPDQETLILLAIEDITVRKQAEEASLRLAAIVASSDDAIVSKSLDGVVTSWNAAAERIFGYRAEEMIGQPILRLLPEERHDEEAMILERVRRGEHVDHFETVRRTKEGWLLDVSLSVSPLRDAHGTIIGASKIARDITVRKKAEAALTESELRWRTLAETLPALVWMAHPDGFVDYYNSRWSEYTGLNEAQLAGWGWEAVWHPEDLPEGRARWLEALRTGQPYECETRLRRTDGSFHWHLNRAVSVRDQEGRVLRWLGSNTDIEEQKHTAAELQRANEEFQQFSHIVAHDLNEPLRTMSSFVNLLAQRYQGKLDATADEYIAFVTDAAQRMKQMIADLLAYTRIGGPPAALTTVDSEALLARILNELQVAIADAKAEVTHDPLPTVQGDETRLGQVLQNLIGNALKFCKEAPRIHITAQHEDQHWRFAVQDSGIGIDPAQTKRLFQIFQRLHTRSEYPGTGIGLAICKRIIEQHGGHIWVESQPGEGSTFSFTVGEKSSQ